MGESQTECHLVEWWVNSKCTGIKHMEGHLDGQQINCYENSLSKWNTYIYYPEGKKFKRRGPFYKYSLFFPIWMFLGLLKEFHFNSSLVLSLWRTLMSCLEVRFLWVLGTELGVLLSTISCFCLLLYLLERGGHSQFSARSPINPSSMPQGSHPPQIGFRHQGQPWNLHLILGPPFIYPSLLSQLDGYASFVPLENSKGEVIGGQDLI